MLAQLTGAAPTTAYTLSSLAAAVWLFPLSAALLTWQLLIGRDHPSGAPPGRRPPPPRCRRRSPSVPYVEFDTASMPNMAAYGIAVPAFVLITSSLRNRDRIPLAVLALIGVFSVHITGGVVVVTFVVAWWLLEALLASGAGPGARLRHARRHRRADPGRPAAAVPRRAAAGRDHRRARLPHPSRAASERCSTRSSSTPATSTTSRSRIILIALAGAGFVLLLIKRIWWPAGGVGAAGRLDRAFVGPVRRPDRRDHRHVQRPVLQRPAPAVGGGHHAADPDGRCRAVRSLALLVVAGARRLTRRFGDRDPDRGFWIGATAAAPGRRGASDWPGTTSRGTAT